MRNLALVALGVTALFMALDWQAFAAAPQKSKAPAKTSTAKKGTAASAAKSTSTRGKKSAPKVTWRNRQTAPAPERYKEIQEALAAKGYLTPEEADGTWNLACAEALKRFQSDQKLNASGKINSLSLIALGLGPKRDGPAAKQLPAADPSAINR